MSLKKCPQISKDVKRKQINTSNNHKCTQCDIFFKKKRNSKSKHVFCSKNCYTIWNRGENTAQWNRGEKMCKQCGEKYNPNRTVDGRRKYGGRGNMFCSCVCRQKYLWKNNMWTTKKGKRVLQK